MRKLLFTCLLLLLLIISSIAAFAESLLSDPDIPNGETTAYQVEIEGRIFARTQKFIQKTENNREVYDVYSESQNEDQRLTIDRITMEVMYSWTKYKEKYYVVDKEITTYQNTFPSKKNEMVVIEFMGVTHLFRGFSFIKPHTIKVRTSQGGDILLYVAYTREVDIDTKLGKFRCYQVEMGLDGILGLFFPKTYIWYTKAAPHYMVKYEGISGGPGSPVMKMEITAYSVK